MIDAPLMLYRTTVPEQWLDYNGHMSEWCYLLLAGDAADKFFRYAGIDETYRAAGHSLYTVETHLHHLRESGAGDRLAVPLHLLDAGPKSVHIFHTMLNEATGEQVATAEQLLVHVDMASGRVVPMPDDLMRRFEAVRAAHAELPVPAAVGHVMRVRRPADSPRGNGSTSAEGSGVSDGGSGASGGGAGADGGSRGADGGGPGTDGGSRGTNGAGGAASGGGG
jgi:carnitine 3-dehydrogenase